MSKQLTAVQWLIEQTKKPEWHSLKRGDILEQANEMFKKQLLNCSKKSYIAGYLDNQCKINDSSNFPEDYYNETFGTNE